MKIEYDALTNDFVINCTGGACGKLIKLARYYNMNEEEYLHFIKELKQALDYTNQYLRETGLSNEDVEKAIQILNKNE